jgi:tetratricopeptide (TPR) repeat protein
MPRRRLALPLGLALATAQAVACGNWDPRQPFEREAPQVKTATLAYDAGDARAAMSLLEDYLATGVCKEGAIGAPESLAERREGTFDLSLALFAVAEAFGARFQDDANAPGARTGDPKARKETIACALRIARAVIEARDTTYPLRARAHYLEGNLHFLAGDYAEAIKAYERALVLVPGEGDAGDPVGRDAAWNRAVAMRRLEDSKDAGPDGGSSDGGGGEGGDASGEGGKDDGGKDGGKDQGKDGGKNGEGKDKEDKNKKDKDKDKSGKGKDGGAEGSNQQPQPPEQNEQQNGDEDGGAQQPQPPPPQPAGEEQGAGSASPDERVLDSLERAPLLQHELSRRAAANRRVRGSADK